MVCITADSAHKLHLSPCLKWPTPACAIHVFATLLFGFRAQRHVQAHYHLSSDWFLSFEVTAMHALVAVPQTLVRSGKCLHVRLSQSSTQREDSVSPPDAVMVVHLVVGCLQFTACLKPLSCSALKAGLASRTQLLYWLCS